MNNQDPHAIIDRYPDAERANRNKNISIVPFASDRLDNSFNIFLSTSGLYQVFKLTSPANMIY